MTMMDWEVQGEHSTERSFFPFPLPLLLLAVMVAVRWWSTLILIVDRMLPINPFLSRFSPPVPPPPLPFLVSSPSSPPQPWRPRILPRRLRLFP